MKSKYRFPNQETIFELTLEGIHFYFPDKLNKKKVKVYVYDSEAFINTNSTTLYKRKIYEFQYTKGRWKAYLGFGKKQEEKKILKLLNEGDK